MIRLFRFGNGTVRLRVSDVYAVRLINRMYVAGIDFFDLKKENGIVSFSVVRSDKKRLFELCRGTLFEPEIVSEQGAPALVFRYRKRIGLLVGSLLGLALLFMSDRFVWKIRITGNETVSDSEILEALSTCGFQTGTYLPSLDFYDLCTRAAIACPGLSWVGINMKGTTACIEVKELQNREGMDYLLPDDAPSNLVASEDGVIERMEIFNGEPVVKVGDTVQKGDLLVSGISAEGGRGPFRVNRSKGSVFARTTKVFCVDVPMISEEKVYSGTVGMGKSIIFFGNEIKIGKDGRLSDVICETIYEKEYISVFGVSELPLMLCRETDLAYEIASYRMTKEEAFLLASAEMTAQTASSLCQAEILARNTEVSCITLHGAPVLRLICEIQCIDNIAREKSLVPSGTEAERDQFRNG